MSPTPDQELAELQVTSFLRAVPIEINRKKEGDGRTVEAYACAFDSLCRITGRYFINEDFWEDDWGTYDEIVRKGAFKKTLQEGGKNAQYLYNHGMDLYRGSSERYSMPIGVPLEISEDSTGLLTVTRMSKTPLGDEILELIDDGAIRAYSFQGKAIQSKITRATKDGDVDLVERIELTLKEFGPCVFPANDQAKILTVRAETIANKLTRANLSSNERAEIIRLLQNGTSTSEAAGDTARTDVAEPPAPDTSQQAAPEAPASVGPSLSLLSLEQQQRARASAL